MIDVWCTFGEMAVDPAIWSSLPSQMEIIQVKLKEIIGGVEQPEETINTMGLLKKDATEAVRVLLDERFVRRFGTSAPPVSLYCAGRASRLKVADGSVMAGGFAGFHQCYLNAYGTGPAPTAEYVVAMGASMVDSALKADFLTEAGANARSAEFRLNRFSSEFGLFAQFLNDPNFDTVQNQWLQAECWERICPDRAIWYYKSPRLAN